MDNELVERLKQDIPEGVYCYRILETEIGGTGFRIKTEVCPFYSTHKDSAFCTLLMEEEDLLDDQCKICHENIGDLE